MLSKKDIFSSESILMMIFSVTHGQSSTNFNERLLLFIRFFHIFFSISASDGGGMRGLSFIGLFCMQSTISMNNKNIGKQRKKKK